MRILITLCFRGISIAEEVIKIISTPFTNYVLASNDKNLLEEYSSKLLLISDEIECNNSGFSDNYNLKSSEFKKNLTISLINLMNRILQGEMSCYNYRIIMQ